MKDNCPHIPKVRFPGFKNPWQQFKVGDFIDFYPTNTLSWEQLQYGINGIKNIHYGLIHTYLPTLVDIRKCTLPSILQNQLPHKYKLCKKGDIVLTDASEDIDGIAKCVELINLGGQNIICGLHTIHGRDNKHITSVGFKGYLFNAEIFRSQIRKSTQGIKVFSISNKTIAAFNISIPCTQEQMKIVKCLASIDKLIEQQRKELEALKQHKQALMQQLFPQRSQDTPALRFLNTRKGWKYEELKKITSHCTKKNTKEEETIVLTNSAQYGVIRQQDYFDRDIVTSSNLKNYYIVEVGDFVYNPRISIAAPVGPVSKNNLVRGIISPLYLVFRFNDDNNDFYVYYFQSIHWQMQLKKIANSGARFDRMSISTTEFFDIKVPNLSKTESVKIASLLCSLDRLINCQQAKYDLLVKHKKGLMQQLFPS